MAGCLIVISYFIIGIIANKFYEKRDIKLSVIVDGELHRLTEHLKKSSPEAADFMLDNFSRESIKNAGWCFWRRKWIFSVLSMKTKNIIGFLVWPIDIVLCEIGYKRERRYINERHNFQLHRKECEA